MPSWALGYSTNVEWKILDRKITVDVQEYWDPIDKVRSITASIEGTTAQIILDDKNQEYSTIINSKYCCISDIIDVLCFISKDLVGV